MFNGKSNVWFKFASIYTTNKDSSPLENFSVKQEIFHEVEWSYNETKENKHVVMIKLRHILK